MYLVEEIKEIFFINIKVYISLIAFAKVVKTNGRASQNQGLKDGRTSITRMITVKTKKYSHHFLVEVDSLINFFSKIILKLLPSSIQK
jgi:hypothetical protein